MRRILEALGLVNPLSGLESILDRVADGQLTPHTAARQIRNLAARQYLPPWLPRLFQVMGVMFAVVGVGFGCYSMTFGFGTSEVHGEVTKMVGGSPLVEYQVNGVRFSHRSPISSSPPAYFVGEKVKVLYRRTNPASAQINSFTERWLFCVAFTGGGMFSIICGRLFPRWMAILSGTNRQELPSESSQHSGDSSTTGKASNPDDIQD